MLLTAFNYSLLLLVAPARNSHHIQQTLFIYAPTTFTSDGAVFTCGAAPAISAIHPALGPATGGTTVTISGKRRGFERYIANLSTSLSKIALLRNTT